MPEQPFTLSSAANVVATVGTASLVVEPPCLGNGGFWCVWLRGIRASDASLVFLGLASDEAGARRQAREHLVRAAEAL